MTLKTLVVDNNPVLLKAVSALLEQEHCEVRTAGNGLDALEALKEYRPDILFTDLIMPLVGGEQLCKIVRKTPEYKDIFLVVLSAILLEDRRRILADLDYDLCIAKGSLQELRDHLREALALFEKKVRVSNMILGGTPTEEAAGTEGESVLGELLSEKYHLKEIVENLVEGIIELSPQGKIVSLNRAAVTILGRDREELIGVAFASLPWGEHGQEIRRWLQDELMARGGRPLEVLESDPVRLRDRILSASLLPVRENDHIFAVCILRDITRQFTAEQQKREFDNAIRLVKKMDSMSCMAGGMAHDFNNLLMAICGNLDLLAGPSGEGTLENTILLENARKAAYMTVDLIRKISCFSPFGIINRRDEVVEDLVRETAARFFGERNASYSCSFGTEKNLVTIDREQIGVALSNILQNAVEAGATGPILITVAREIFDAPSVKAGQYVPEGSFVRITVRDDGKGIENENLLKVFDPYFSTKQRGAVKGMGLGLTIVYSTLRNHGGYVVIESEPGTGTNVSLFLPAYQSPADRNGPHPEGGDRKRTVLLMEQEEQLRTIGKIMLEFLGFRTRVATCLDEVVSGVKDGIARKSPIAMAIVNVPGPVQTNGPGICRILHDLDPGLRIVLTSGSMMEATLRNYRKYGFVNTLPKPYTVDDMKRVTSVL